MSTPPLKSTTPRDPFSLLKAILIGLSLGFIAVMLVPYLFPVKVEEENPPARMASGSPRPAAEAPPAGIPPANEAGGSQDTGSQPRFGGQSPAQPAKPEGSREQTASAPAQIATEQPANKDNQTPVPAAPAPVRESAEAAPTLVPAANTTFPKLFSSEDMTAALQPLLSFKISDEDAAAVKEAVAAAARDDGDDAKVAIKKIKDSAAKTFAEWKRLNRSDADFDEVMAFRRAHPLFPEPPQDASFEKNLFLSKASSADILKFYTNRSPLTGAGKASLGGALLDTDEREQGLALIKLAWSRYIFDPAVEAKFVARFGALLDKDDQARRKLLLSVRAAQGDDPGKKEASESREKTLKAKNGKGRSGRHEPGRARRGKKGHRADIGDGVLQKEAAAVGKARAFHIASLAEQVKFKKPNRNQKAKENKAQKTLEAKAAEDAFNLADERAGAPATLLSRLKALRKKGADDELWSLLRSIGPDTADLADPDRWWEFRRSEIRRALNEDHPKTAYAIARVHGPL
ncbi:MAG: hypothetical protein HY765_08180, partial [Rhodomicrobium sp.]|nr:hypothetical protein [Rhodomicrobium sp.]